MRLQGGFTLIETLVVLFIVSVIASVVLPELSSSNPVRLDAASNEVASALRFAREESIRTGQVHGVDIDVSTTRLFVFKAGTGANPLVGLSIVYHPFSKQLYDSVLSDNYSGLSIAVPAVDLFNYYMLTSGEPYVLFDEEGTPFLRQSSTGDSFLLELSEIDLVNGDLSKQVIVEPGYGRVIVE